MKVIGWALLGIASLIIAIVFARTLKAVIGGHLFVPE